MKKVHYLFVSIAFAGMLAFWSCNKDRYAIDEPVNPDIKITIADLKSIYQGKDIKLGKDITTIYGTVISDATSGNMPAGYLVLQQGSEGITLSLKDSPEIPFMPGDSVMVNVSGASLERVNGNLILAGPTLSDVTKLEANRVIKPKQVLLRDLADNFNKYQGTLIKVAAADIVPTPQTGDTYAGSKGLSDGSGEAGAIKLYTFSGAAFAGKQALANAATYTGIAMYSTDGESASDAEKQLWLRNESDIENTSIPLTSDVIITGILANPRGADGPVKGTSVSYSGGSVIVVHSGGYEYVQLMALRDIDFSKTPYSVVISNNGAATAKGWAEGGNVTFKFNLTSGSAAEGTFFYIGGPSKVIAGYYPTGKSTDISNANWIRTIDYNVGDASKVVGDGFGNSTAGILGNGSPADGIAVFKGTDVTPSSVPIDVVFINPPAGSALSGSNGYLIPSSDLYSPVNKQTGEEQPLFGQGTNTFGVEDVGGGDISRFAKMGGVVTKNSWIVPRKPTIVTLQPDSKLEDIEASAGVTFFRK